VNTIHSLLKYPVVGTHVNAVQYTDILNQVDAWVRSHSTGHFVVVANTHVVMESRQNHILGEAVRKADMVIPDGMPLVVVGRMRGFPLKRRADGPGLLVEALKQSGQRGWRHYFYGGTPELLAAMQARIAAEFPGVQVAGAFAPPFRPLTEEEDRQVVEAINAAHPDIVWVGLGCPKQERWMLEHAPKLNVPVMFGVGLAFDLLAGTKKRAPGWMCNTGLEWLYRLLQEPRRLWKRYFLYNPWFVWLVLLEQVTWMRKGRKQTA